MELLQVADAVAREKNIDRDEVLEAMEQAIQKAGRSKYGHEHDIRARIDRKTGDIHLMRYLEVVETVENETTQLTLREAQRMKKDAALGEFLTDELPPIDFGRIAATNAISDIYAMGGTATPIAASEQYTALSQGIIDGADHSLAAHVVWQLYDYAKYFTETNHALQTSYYVISAKTMASLPQEYQDIIREVMAEEQENQYDITIEDDAGYRKTFEDNGGQIVTNDEIDHEAFNAALADIIDEFKANAPDLYDGIRAMAD